MTIEERAEDVAYDLEVNDWHEDGCSLDYKDAKKKIAAAITEAVAEEREACALVAEACEPAAPSEIWRAAQAGIAAAIRARATHPEQP